MKTYDVTLTGLTVDELMTIQYLLGTDPSWGDPLKDIYELEQQMDYEMVAMPTTALRSAQKKIGMSLMSVLKTAVEETKP